MKCFISFLLLLGVGLACNPPMEVLVRSQLLMGHVPVTVQIRAPASQRDRALQASEGAYDLARRLEAKISEYDPNSETSCLNREAGKHSCPVGPSTLKLLTLARELNGKTQGAFDIRFASLSGEGRKGSIDLDPAKGTAKLQHPQTRIGMGAIGKGFIVDAMGDLLKEQGFPDHLISAGGDLLASGASWKVGVQVPGARPGEFVHEATIKNRAMATSGTYEQGNHIFNPLDGNPVTGSKGVTVWADRLTEADALATALFVLGENQTQKLLNTFPGIRVQWTDADGKYRIYK